MAQPYPPRWTAFDYRGRPSYALTYATDGRSPLFTDVGAVELVREQFLRAASEKQFSIIAYCFMPDHLHAVVRGCADDSDCRAFVKAAKQYSGFYFKQRHERPLWDRYGHDRVIRDERELAMTIR
jgi:putative transposase